MEWIPPDEGPAGPGGIDTSTNQQTCAEGQVETAIDVNGKLHGGNYECVSPEEAQRRGGLYTGTGEDYGKQGGGTGGTGGTGSGGGTGGPSPVGGPSYKFTPIPDFIAPTYGFNEQWKAPTADEAFNDPGYQFAQKAGLGAIQNAAWARGAGRTSGAVKDLAGWANDYATQKYDNVFDRNLTGFKTRQDSYNQGYDRTYQGAKDMYAPKLHEWDVKTNFGTQSARDAFEAAWKKWFWDNPSADSILNAGKP